ncbi:MAG TPA: hypothetical protein VFL57_08895 [Bryobacteraceae bacterium]|nr:hypothetical protein [Bryobacteraceae bacterium]
MSSKPLTAAPSIASAPYVPAAPVHKVAVALPASVRAMIQGELTTEVRVRIDERGRVVAAQAARENSSLLRNLAELARNTAYMWRFTPARLGERPIPSDYTIVFKFRK